MLLSAALATAGAGLGAAIATASMLVFSERLDVVVVCWAAICGSTLGAVPWWVE